ncbi:hypothetical protein PF007_g684 [Phytophthora fragariae]|uniref:Uncharacterized protein n=1 Tax=Phytophthora fragariae TaxID=53985 RepID=A0A6A3FZ81_9STRA|nr:hypothetical protein PF009_g702 [Phytophthora fragariae]KAE9000866.1 hypothetical protein PF011_g14000 [Phytophthora fragariae]KAE9140385.1 hypothetical protein PF007_g684 [Phytophthora fragariae]KAE9227762.1 hypothetical protein PF004_g11266 [Phytophthora fragariae]KAE9329481.1 hypothetical protein PF001_g892 [Phytophthora fragariae]
MNLDWWGLPKFTDKKLYAGMGADWVKTLVQRLSRADDERRGLAARLQDSCFQWQVGRSGFGLIREDAASLGFRVKRDGPHGGPDARVLHYEDAGNQGDGAGVGAEGPGKSPSITRCTSSSDRAARTNSSFSACGTGRGRREAFVLIPIDSSRVDAMHHAKELVVFTSKN